MIGLWKRNIFMNRKNAQTALLLAWLGLGYANAATAAPAPKLRQQSIEELAPLPYPYDERLDAQGALASARARAIAQHKLLLVDLGANWCADCRVLGGVMNIPEVQAFVKQHYEVVTIDVGSFDHNMNIVHRLGIKELRGVPAVVIIDPATGRVINSSRIFALSDARSISPQGLADWLARWTK